MDIINNEALDNLIAGLNPLKNYLVREQNFEKAQYIRNLKEQLKIAALELNSKIVLAQTMIELHNKYKE